MVRTNRRLAFLALPFALSLAAFGGCTGDDPIITPSVGGGADGADVGDAAVTEGGEGGEGGEGADAADGSSVLNTRVEVAAALATTCALRASGEVYCWGDNTCGQLGLGSHSAGQFTPLLAALPVRGARIVAGTGSFCVLARDGTVWCWGRNDKGQLGHSPNSDTENAICGTGFAFAHEATPKQVAGFDHVVELSAGSHHVCARKGDGSVWCWGGNDTLQLGHDPALDVGCGGGGTCSPTPIAVPGLVANALGMGSHHSCALTKSGAVCWGDNNTAQLGHTGEDDVVVGGVTMNSVPKPAIGGGDAVAIAGGEDFTCALTATNAVSCWGLDNFGQLGARQDGGSTTGSAQPVTVPGLPSMLKVIGVGDNYACAAGSGALTCWGNDEYAQAGPKGDGGSTTPPLDVPGPGLGDVAQIAANATHTCALTGSGSVVCWGQNDSGQLGHDPAADRSCGTGCLANPTPTQVVNLP